MTFLVIHTALLMVLQHSLCHDLCPNKSPDAIIRLEEAPTTIMNFHLSNITATIHQAPNSIRCISYLVRRILVVCEARITFSRQCTKEHQSFFPPRHELDDGYDKGVCAIGKTCTEQEPCWGGDLTYCTGEFTRNHWTPPTGYVDVGHPDDSVFRQTCAQKWECHITELRLTPQLSRKHSSGVYVTLPNGEEMELSQDSPSYWANKDEPSYMCSKAPLIEYQAVANCINSSKSINCLVEETRERPQVVFSEIPLDACQHIDGRQSITFPCVDVSDSDFMSRISDRGMLHLDGAASIHSVIEAINQLHFLQSQTIFNLLALLKDQQRGNTLLLKVMKHLAYKDKTLLGQLMDTSVASEAVTPDLFLITTCATSPAKSSSQLVECQGKYKWVGDRWQLRMSTDKCSDYTNLTIRNIQLFGETTMQTTMLAQIDVNQSQILNYVISQIQDELHVPQTKDDYKQSASYPWELHIWDSISGTLRTLSSVLPFLNILFILCLFRRR